MFDEYTNRGILRSNLLHETACLAFNRMKEKQRVRLCSYTVPLNIVEDLQEMLVLVCCDENECYDEDDDFT